MSYLDLRYFGPLRHAPDQYSAVEIECVAERGGSIDVNREKPDFFSVYARRKDGLAECIGDFGQYAWAHKFAVDMVHQHGWAFVDLVPDKFK